MRVSRRAVAGESVTKDNRAEEGEKGGHTLLKEGILCLRYFQLLANRSNVVMRTTRNVLASKKTGLMFLA